MPLRPTVSALALLLLGGCVTQIPVLGDDAGADAAAPDAGADAPHVCPGADDCPACLNGTDDDGDDRIDYPSDPGCADRDDDDESEPAPPGPCANGVDDDGDRLIDYPRDPGCSDEEDGDETDPPPPRCANGSDDDADGDADFPADPGCASLRDDDESDACPGAGCPACGNGVDDDGDGALDFGDDLECIAASDEDERCLEVGNGFEDAWPGDFVGAGGAPPMGSRRASAAHSGRFGLDSPFFLTYVPGATSGAAGERVSVWTRAAEGAGTILALHFAIEGEHSYACMLDLADHLVVYEQGAGGLAESLATVPAAWAHATWYRLEASFDGAGGITCTATADGASAPLATVTHVTGGSTGGAVGVRGLVGAAFDELEVCR